MESRTRVLEPESVLGLLALLEDMDAVPLVITGSSMIPFLAPGRDTVYLSRVERPLRRGDMVFYRRSSGAYVLHRIIRVDGNTFTLIGDAQTQPEPGIRREQVLAVVTCVRRKGCLLHRGSLCWDFFQQIWSRMIPLRPLALRVYSGLKKLRN